MNIKHGEATGARSQEYRAWDGMKQRCLNPNHEAFVNYGERGITICDRWLVFSNFFEDMGKKPNPEYTLERKDNSKGYNKDNCIWATREEQAKIREHQFL